MMSTVIVHASINLNVQCAETGGIHDVFKKREKSHIVQSHSQNRWVFRRLRNAAKESASLIALLAPLK